MLPTVVLLLLCALTAIAGVPLILKLVPPNAIYGVRTEKALSREDVWYEVNRFGGWSLVGAAAGTVLALIIWSGTLLRPFWLQLAVFVLALGVAVGATLWYERRAGQRRTPPRRRSRKSSRAS
jgi:uncharacterized membrane protein